MSLLSRDRVAIALYPDRLSVARMGGALRPRLREQDTLELEAAPAGAPTWQPAVDALARTVTSARYEGATVTLVLSSRFVRYVLVPWSDALRADDEQLAYARERCRSIHGGAADAWELRAARAVRGEPRVACAVESALLVALDEAMRPLKRRYRSVQPHLMACFNRWRARATGRPEWFVVHEPGLLSIGLLCAGQWRSLRSVKVRADWRERLAGVLTREQCMTELPEPVTRVLLVTEDGDEAVPMTEPWHIERLSPGADAHPAWVPA